MLFPSTVNIKGFSSLPFRQYVALLVIHNQQTNAVNRLGKEGVTSDKGQMSSNGDYKNDLATDNGNDLVIHTLVNLMQTLYRLGSDPKLLGLKSSMVQSCDIDYSNLYNYIHLAEFALDDVIFIDKIPSFKLAMHYSSDDLVGLLCWLVIDVEFFFDIGIDTYPSEVRSLAQVFSERYITIDQKLLSNTSYEDQVKLIDELLHIFNTIMRYHPPVDSQVQEVCDAIEAYLSYFKMRHNAGIDGDLNAYQGNEMYDIWEMLCLDNELKNEIACGWQVLIVDATNLTRGTLNECKLEPEALIHSRSEAPTKKHDIKYFDGKRPDLVLYKKNKSDEVSFVSYRVIDFKYYDYENILDIDNKTAALNELNKPNKGSKSDAFYFYFDKSKDDILKSQGYCFGVHKFHMEKYPKSSFNIILEFWVAGKNGQKTIDVFNPGQLLIPKSINDMVLSTLGRYKVFER